MLRGQYQSVWKPVGDVTNNFLQSLKFVLKTCCCLCFSHKICCGIEKTEDEEVWTGVNNSLVVSVCWLWAGCRGKVHLCKLSVPRVPSYLGKSLWHKVYYLFFYDIVVDVVKHFDFAIFDCECNVVAAFVWQLPQTLQVIKTTIVTDCDLWIQQTCTRLSVLHSKWIKPVSRLKLPCEPV